MAGANVNGVAAPVTTQGGAGSPDGGAAPIFPANILDLIVEILVNGVWVDISEYIYQREPVVITRGQPDYTQSIQTAQMTLTANNQDGRFSPRNASGEFYPYLVRNTQIRVSVNAQSRTGSAYFGYRFWGEVATWPSRWDVTGRDVWVSVVANGITRRYNQAKALGSSLRRYYATLPIAYRPIAYWPCEDLTNSDAFSSGVGEYDMTWSGAPELASNSEFRCSDPLPLMSNKVWTGLTGSYSASGDEFFTSPGTHQWVAQADSVTPKVFGGAGGGTNGQRGYAGGGGEYASASVAVTTGETYTVYVGAGGSGGALTIDSHRSGGNGQDSYFVGDAVTVRAHGGKGGTYAAPGQGGTGSTNTTHHDGGDGGGRGYGDYGGGGGGSSAGTGANGNNGANCGHLTGGAGGTAPAGGFKGGRGGDSPYDAGLGTPGTPGGAGGAGAYDPGPKACHGGRYGGSGRVELSYTPVGAPNNVVVRFLLSVPAGGGTGGKVLLRALGSSTVAKLEVYYVKGGKVGIRGYNSVGGGLFDGTAQPWNVDGKLIMVTAELAKSGANIAWTFQVAYIADTVTYSMSQSSTFAGTMGSITQVVANVDGGQNDVAMGHITVQYARKALNDAALATALLANAGEKAATRFLRLCSEKGITGTLVGVEADTPAMGPQLNKPIMELFQECADADMGLIFEPRDSFGLGYRTRVSMQGQAADVTLDYASKHLSGPLEPIDDDQFTRNDVTISRVNGGQTRVTLDSGAMSIADPPDGVGPYVYTGTLNLSTDAQTVEAAAWALTLGTQDLTRYPVIPVDLSRAAVADLFASVPALDSGDRMAITTLPAWLPAASVSLLLFGFAETLRVTGPWEFVFNTGPEDAYSGQFLTGDNASFEASTGTWIGTGNCNLARVGSPVRSGSGAMSMTCSLAGNYSSGSCSAANILTQGLPCETDDTITAHAYLRGSAARSVQIGAEFYDAGGISLTTLWGSTVSDITSGWTRVTATLTAPTDAAFCRARIQVVSALLGEVHYVDDAYIGNMPRW